MTVYELRAVLEAHAEWLRGDGGRRADLRGAYLRGSDLRGAHLHDADLRGAYLRGSDLRGAHLYDADLRGAYLRDADLRDADLRGAYLHDADLRDSDLRDAYLRDADLRGAYLHDADLRDSDLRDAYLRGAVGFHYLTRLDHGYTAYATLRGDDWRVIAGCRDYSIDQAIEHWGSPGYHTPSSGRRMVACLRWLQEELGAT